MSAVTQPKEGDLVVDMREHNPRVGCCVLVRDRLYVSFKPEVKISSFADDCMDFRCIENIEHHFLPYAGETEVGCRVPREIALGGRQDTFARLPGELTLASFRFYPEYAADKLTTIHDAIRFLERRSDEGKVEGAAHDPWNSSTSTSAISRHNSPFQNYPSLAEAVRNSNYEFLNRPFADYKFWSETDYKILVGESARQQSARADWISESEAISALFRAMGACVEQDTNAGSEEVIANASLNEIQLDELAELTAGFKTMNVSVVSLLDVDCLMDDYCESICAVVSTKRVGRLVVPNSTPLAPTPDETIGEYAVRIATPAERFTSVVRAWHDCKGSASLFRAMTRRYSQSAEPSSFAVDGLLPSQAVSLLVGQSGIGKSTIALQMAACVASGGDFCGLPVRNGYAVYITAEDSEAVIFSRLDPMSQSFTDLSKVIVLGRQDNMPIEAMLREIAALENVSLVIVDTVAAFCPRVNDGGPAREFMQALSDFAIARKCAVLALHHVNKGVGSKSARSVFTGAKGSNEFTNAARIVLTLHVEGNLRVMGIGKMNLSGNTPSLAEPLRLQYDAATEMHTPIIPPVIAAPADARQSDIITPDKSHTSKATKPSDAELAAVVILRERKAGKPVHLTGDKELFKVKAPELQGWSRTRCRVAHREASDAGLV
jgi:hypothetical protein